MNRCCSCNPYIPINYVGCRCRRYGPAHFLGDVFMTCITGGVWLIWVVIRELRHT